MHPKFDERLNKLAREAYDPRQRHIDTGGGPPHDGGGSEPPMELAERVGVLEKDVSAIKTDVAVIRVRLDDFASKADLHREINNQTWKFITWMTGVCGVLAAAVFFIAKNVH